MPSARGCRSGFFGMGVLLVALSSARASAVPCASLACGSVVTGAIAQIGGTDCYSFTVSDAEIVELTVLTDASGEQEFELRWRLTDATGAPAASCGSLRSQGRFDCGPLPAGGNPYRVEVSGASDEDTGTYDIQLQRLTAATLCAPASSQCRIDPPSESDLLGFTVGEGDRVSVSVAAVSPSGRNFEPYWRVLDSSGMPVTPCGDFTLASTLNCGPLATAGNPYRIEVTDFFADDSGTYSVSVDGTSLCAAGPLCSGDCNGDDEVSIAELVRGVNIALDTADLTECPRLDDDGNGRVSINELIAAVSNALNGCPRATATAFSSH